MEVYYPALFAVLAGVSGLVGLALQSVYPILLVPVCLLVAGYFTVSKKKQAETRNYTPSFMILSSAALAFGLGFKSIVPYAMLIGIALHMVCIVCAFIALGRYQSQS
ncbi:MULTISPECIES: hypothetical protein [unclassified Exiguobacterium]|uniref:hypothetical protein n=1 Tax=unclassified Exiguobacterium TaxID=2644629 RepID=UPI0008D0B0FF|nr:MULTISPECIES: hypothetical protein [unclassified Exiguobacterium]OGX78722.1 hypothetical protein A6395_10295 [Exiguobacterium sp. SH31]TCI34036.1 hypothetical protein EVJ29_12480 [Exiguobacterium sp. SH4S7]TCI43026.1 hypothetical protein EVJ31_12755 [Exiguobacterium sp. SH5S32]TCI49812.1 hypothetical protein EVJ25_13260 [Exiguobacterium sp. SH1S4]TCI51887.1 hypothetical protein EVJ24_12185 [Exiguobacterium sp. SH1S21]